ncbi:MAG: phasin family protein [Sphingobium sp.]|nr:phasin family protein [Sphingobium sp.]
MAKAPIKKSTSRSAAAARKAAPTKAVTAAPVGEVLSKPVEWPVSGPPEAAKKSEKIAVPPKAEPVSTPAVAPKAAKVVEPVAVTPAAPIVTKTVIPGPATAPAVAKAAKKGTSEMTDALETAKAYAEDAKSKFQSAFTDASEKAKVALEKSSKAIEELGELAKGNYEAIVESSKIAAKGVETLSQEAVEFSRKSFEKSTATFKSFAAVKTPAEFFQLQTELVSATFDSFATETAKNSEKFLKLAGEVSQPISNRVAIVSEKVKKLAA